LPNKRAAQRFIGIRQNNLSSKMKQNVISLTPGMQGREMNSPTFTPFYVLRVRHPTAKFFPQASAIFADKNESVINRMDALKYRRFTVAAVMFGLFAAQENRGFSAYLKDTGPAPLRFSVTPAVPASFVLPVALVEPQKPTNTTEIAVSTMNSGQTNAVAAVPASTPAPSPTAVPGTESPAKPAPTPSASEMLVVSPQMLTEFFRPVAEGTNSASTVVVPVMTPLPVGFNPPLVKSPSRATYNTP
jgi:hypothetical protein